MNQSIKNIVESFYINATEQMYNSMHTAEKAAAKYEKDKTCRRVFLLNIMGKSLYDKCTSHGALGTFAPIPFTGLKFNNADFLKFAKNNGFSDDIDTYMNFIDYIAASFPKRQFAVRGDEVYSDIVFTSLDSLIDFFEAVAKAVKKVYKCSSYPEDLNWKPLTIKIKNYFK